MPIATVIGASLGSVAIGGLNWLGMKINGVNPGGWWQMFVHPLIIFGVFGFLWGLISYSMSPTGKVIAASVMTTVLGVLCMASILMVYNNRVLPTGNKVHSIIAVLAALVGAIVAVVYCHNRDRTNY